MSEPHPYIIVKDNDCHTYVIPRDKKAGWEAWCAIPEPDYRVPEDERDYRSWDVPEYAVIVGGHPDRVTFNLDGTFTID